MTGAWFPRRGWNPATLVIDSRPLIIRAVRLLHIRTCGLLLTAHYPLQPPYILFFSLFMICAGLTLPRTSGTCSFARNKFRRRLTVRSSSPLTDYSLFYYFLLWFTVAIVSLAFIFVHGIDYVNWPRLQPLTDIIYYDGPGFRSARKGTGLGLPAVEKLKEGATERAKAIAEQHRRVKSKRLEEIEMGTKRVD